MNGSRLIEVFGHIVVSFTRGVVEHYNPKETELTAESLGYNRLGSTGLEWNYLPVDELIYQEYSDGEVRTSDYQADISRNVTVIDACSLEENDEIETEQREEDRAMAWKRFRPSALRTVCGTGLEWNYLPVDELIYQEYNDREVRTLDYQTGFGRHAKVTDASSLEENDEIQTEQQKEDRAMAWKRFSPSALRTVCKSIFTRSVTERYNAEEPEFTAESFDTIPWKAPVKNGILQNITLLIIHYRTQLQYDVYNSLLGTHHKQSHDDTTVAQLKEAIDSYGGVKGCWAAVCELHQTKQMLTPVKWTGIGQLNNFQYECGSIKIWRAFHVGLRSRIKALPMKSTQQVTGIKVLKPFRALDSTKGELEKPASRSRNRPSAKDAYEGKRNYEETASALFSCPEEGCIKVYGSNHYLVSHLDFGKHQ
ncbi:hypothetical protein AWC38_SpisGene22517 [Stylophora pistillata]|uniref:C2H2-type domain-containing protein n=1 Tax=Stylophora pistillata TaxID=50429 RepID=A0A2B4R6Z2_STYPI|nr:hypothetical protein AWC38_SpisGene22517 [Stylophora pistillata]